MKKTLLFALALTAVGCADPIPRNLDELVQQGDVYLDRETMSPYSGPIFEFFPDDTTRIQTTGTVKDGQLHGQTREYFENGQLKREGTFVDGVGEGPYASYHEDGELEKKATYVAGEYHGPYESYLNGQFLEKGTYNMGEKCGEWIEWIEYNRGTVTYDPCPPGN
jgi:antitoxin component YwqK of YwqJK toxin-antitoxin module